MAAAVASVAPVPESMARTQPRPPSDPHICLSFGKVGNQHRKGYFEKCLLRSQIGRFETTLDEQCYLTSGRNASVYVLRHPSPRDADTAALVLKLGTGSDSAGLTALQQASKLQLAPRVLKVFSARVSYTEDMKRALPADEEIWQEVDFVVMEKLDGTLESLMARGRATTEDAHLIYALLDRFYQNQFMHHDMKPDNIGYRTTAGGTRSWFVLDFDFVWYGGPPMRLPYNYDTNAKRFRCPDSFYNGWSGVVPAEPVPHWDFVQLTHYCWLTNKHYANDGFVDTMRQLAHQHAQYDPPSMKWQMQLPNGKQWVSFPK